MQNYINAGGSLRPCPTRNVSVDFSAESPWKRQISCDKRQLDTIAETRNALMAQVVIKLDEIARRTCKAFEYSLVIETAKQLKIDLSECRRRSLVLLGHLPKPYEMKCMDHIPGLWADLFNTEISLMCNTLLLDTNIDIANRMCTWAQKNKCSTANPIQYKCLHAPPTGPETLVSRALESLILFNEYLTREPRESRQYYNKLVERLYYITEQKLLQRHEIIQQQRGEALVFLKHLSRDFDIDKCTHNLAVLYFDTFLDIQTRDPSKCGDLGSRVVEVATASYLIAAALREHWVDIAKDSYLEHAVEKSDGTLKLQRIISTQLQLLQVMPKGFTTIYVALEYGLFYLANIRGSGCNCGSGSGYRYGYNCTCEFKYCKSSDFSNTGNATHATSTGGHQGNYNNLGGDFKDANANVNAMDGSANVGRLDLLQQQRICQEWQPNPQEPEEDILSLGLAFRYLVENGAFAWVYHCLSKWDDLYVAKNWNRFIPPSRVAAVLILHMFVDFYQIDVSIHLIWCRRFCAKVFKMYYDCDVALWYRVFQENCKSFLACISKSSQRVWEMYAVFQLAGHKFRAAEACKLTFWARVIHQLLESGVDIAGVNLHEFREYLPAVTQLLESDGLLGTTESIQHI